MGVSEGGESGGEVFEDEEEAAWVLVEVAGDEAWVGGGEIEQGEFGLCESRKRAAMFVGKFFPFFDGEEIVGAGFVEVGREMGLVYDEGIEDEAE